MDKYKQNILTEHKEYINRCYGIIANRKRYYKLSTTHLLMIYISYQMLLDGLY